MDVVVKPSRTEKHLWHLHDRLGREVGSITAETSTRFVVEAAEDGPLAAAANKPSASLKEAMDRIATETKGECELSEGLEG